MTSKEERTKVLKETYRIISQGTDILEQLLNEYPFDMSSKCSKRCEEQDCTYCELRFVIRLLENALGEIDSMTDHSIE